MAVSDTLWRHGRWEDGGKAAMELCPVVTNKYTVDLATTPLPTTREVSADSTSDQGHASLL